MWFHEKKFHFKITSYPPQQPAILLPLQRAHSIALQLTSLNNTNRQYI